MANYVKYLFRSLPPSRYLVTRGVVVGTTLGITLPWFLRENSTYSASARAQVNMGDTIVLADIKKSPLDARTYRALQLGNKMRVVLISDPSTDISAAALSVAAGSIHDPKNIPGLAHFCEHMLFLGTKKYPEENEYNKFLAENAGGSNAYTARDHTCYYFDISPKVLDAGLDRFSQFFISPLFSEAGTEREVNAVNSEHEKNIPHDSWRAFQLEVELSDPNHPYNKFATGNRETLWDIPRKNNIDVRGALLQFHETAYSSNLMNLAVIGKQSLDELQSMVESKFVEVPNRDLPLPRWDDHPYGPSQLKKWVKVVPVKDVRKLEIMFPIPCTTNLYKTGSETYISNLIGHEGPGSLLSLLKEKNWVNSLSAGATSLTRGVCTYKVTVDLTPEGLKNMEDIVFHLFQYLAMLRTEGPKQWIWKESSDLGTVFFRFKDKEVPQSFVAEVAAGLHDYPVEDILSHSYLTTEFNPDVIMRILSAMTPESCIVTSIAKEFESEANLELPYYGTKYSFANVSDELLKKWNTCELHDRLKLPQPNAFIPCAFDQKPRDENKGIIPRILKDSPLTRLWYLQDNEFDLPKGVVVAEMYSPRALEHARRVNLNALFTNAVKDLLTEASYAASLAGIHYDIVPSPYGIEITTHGYDHKLEVLLQMLIDKMVNFNVSEERFTVLKERYIRKLKNFQQEQPYKQSWFYMTYLLKEHTWTVDDLLSETDISPDDLKAYAAEFRSELKFNFLVHGNFTAQEAQSLVGKCEKYFTDKGTNSVDPKDFVRSREVNLAPGTNHVFKNNHPVHSESVACVLYQVGEDETRENVLMELVESIAQEPCFSQLRTQEQLGYIVLCNVRRESGTQGLRILVQSDRHPDYLEERVEDFLEKLTATVEKMTDDEFKHHREGLLTRKEEKPKTLDGRSGRIWAEISTQLLDFDRQAIEVAELKTVEREEFVKFFKTYIAPNAPKRKRASVQVVAAKGAGKDSQIEHKKNVGPITITNPVEWKQSQNYYSVPEGAGVAKDKSKKCKL